MRSLHAIRGPGRIVKQVRYWRRVFALVSIVAATLGAVVLVGAWQRPTSGPRWQVDGNLVSSTFVPEGGVACTSAGQCLVRARLADGLNTVVFDSQGIRGIWRNPTSPLPEQISCPTESVCDGVAEDVNGSLQSALYRTSDGGRHWHRQPLPDGIAIGVWISCPTARDCLVMGFKALAPRPPLRVPRLGSDYSASTVDGGRDWSVTKLAPSLEDLYIPHCPTPSTCLAIAPQAEPARLIETQNRGSNWSLIRFPLGQEGLYFDAISCWSASACAVAFEPAGDHHEGTGVVRLALVKDGAVVAVRPVPGTHIDGFALSCPTAEYCQASETGELSEGTHLEETHVFATTNGGVAWTPVALPRGIRIIDALDCHAPAECTAVGYGHYGRATAVLMRFD